LSPSHQEPSMFVQIAKDFLGQKAGTQLSVSDDEGRDLIDKGYARPVEGDPMGAMLTKSMSDIMGKMTSSFDTAINEAVKNFANAQTLSRKNASKIIFGETGEGDLKGRCFGDWCVQIAKANVMKDENAVKRLNEVYKAAELKAAL